MRSLVVSLLCGSALCLPAAAAQAQGSGAQLEEVVVTARKTEESLQNVPVAVAVVSAQQLKNNLASDLTKVGELAPQVSMGNGGSGTGAVITIRGVSSASNDAGLDQSVAVEIDGIPLSRGRIITSAVFDQSSVQVLQGPQALFFGKNSPAGVISIRSADPTSEFEGYATAGYEFKSDEKFLEGAVSGPLTETLKARLAFRGSKIKGWLHNNATTIPYFRDPTVIMPGAAGETRLPGGSDYSARGTLLWTPTDDFEAKFKVVLNKQKRNGNSTEPFCINGVTQPFLAGGIPLPGTDCEKDMVKTHSALPAKYAAGFPYANGGIPYSKSQYGLASLQLTKKLDNLTLASTTGYYKQQFQTAYSADWGPYATIWATAKESYNLFTQEVRASTDFEGPVNVMVGGYYERSSRPLFNSPDILNHAFNTVAGNYSTVSLASRLKGENYSIFAQARWNILPNLELAGGARYSHDKKDFSMINFGNSPLFPTLYPANVPLEASYKDSNVSPEVSLTWRPTDNQTLYGAYKTGYKSGGISNAFLVFAGTKGDSLKFQPEKVKGGEIGYKATLMDRRLRFDLTAYRYNYSNLQVVAYNASTISFVLQNAASSRIQGVQGSAEWLVMDDLTLRGNFGLNSAKYTDFSNAQCYAGQTAATGCITTGTTSRQDLTGKRLIRAPKATFMFGGDYKLHLAEGWATNLSAQATRTSSYNAATDLSPGGHQKGFWLVNASVRTGPADGPWELALIGRNLTNSYYMLETIGWSGSGTFAKDQFVGTFTRPREVVVQATVRW